MRVVVAVLAGVMISSAVQAKTVSIDLPGVEGAFNPTGWNMYYFHAEGGKQTNWSLPSYRGLVSSVMFEMQGTFALPQYLGASGETVTFEFNNNAGFDMSTPTSNGLSWGLGLGLNDFNFASPGISTNYEYVDGSFYLSMVLRPDMRHRVTGLSGTAHNVFYLSWGADVDEPGPELTNLGTANVMAARLTVSDSSILTGVPFSLLRDGPSAPEPSSWALMLGGFGMIGGIMRNRPKASASFA